MTKTRVITGGIAALSMLVLAGCGGSGAASDTADSTDVVSTVDAAYDGPDQPYFVEVDRPTKVDGQDFEVGFLQISGAQPVLVAMQDAAQEEVEELGGTMIVKDAGLDIQKQQSQMDELITQGVDVIIGPSSSVLAERLRKRPSVAEGDLDAVGQERPEGELHAAAPGDRERAEAEAVVAARGVDERGAPGREARELERGLDRLAAAAGEHRDGQRGIDQAREALGEGGLVGRGADVHEVGG